VRTFTEAAVDKTTGTSSEVTLQMTFTQPKSSTDIVNVTVTTPDDPGFRIPVRISEGGKYVSIGTANTGSLQGKGLYSKVMRPLLKDAETVEGSIGEENTLTLGKNAPHSVLAANSPTAAARGKDFITTTDASGTELTSYRVDQKLSSMLKIATDFEKYKNADPNVVQNLQNKYPAGFQKKNLLTALERYVQENKNLRPEVAEALDKQMLALRNDDFEGIPRTAFGERERHTPNPSPHVSGRKTFTAEDRRSRDTILALPDTPEGLQKRMQSAATIVGKPLSPDQSALILRIHKESPTKQTGVDEEGNATYAPQTLRAWIDAFQSAGIDREQGAKLLRMGVCGSIALPPPPPGYKPKPIPPPPGNKPNVPNYEGKIPPPPLKPPERSATALPQKLPNGINAPPPPPQKLPNRINSTAAQPAQQKVEELNSEKKKMYFQQKVTPMWRQTLGDAERRSSVYSSERGSNHIIWIIDGRGNPTRSVGKNTVTYKYLSSPENAPEHATLVHAEKMLMQAFADAKNMFPPKTKLDDGFAIYQQGKDAGMTTGNALGIGVNSDNTDQLLTLLAQAEKTGNYSMVDRHINWIKSAFAHEMTHNTRGKMDDSPRLNANEVPSHAVQFLSVWDKDAGLFFTGRIVQLRTTPRSTPERIHAELGGLNLVQQKLSGNSHCNYKPKDYSPAELQKAIRSIPENIRQDVIKEITADILRTPIADFEANVRTVFDESKPK
jgi:hypothetical protein